MGSWKKPRTHNGVIQSWYYQADEPWHTSGDGRSFMSLHVPSIRYNEDFYILRIDRGEIEGHIEIHANSHEEAKTEAIEAAREYVRALSLEAALIWKELKQ
jgi:hypothetical protein